MAKNIHVTHRQDGSWAVKGEGDSRASGLYDTQAAGEPGSGLIFAIRWPRVSLSFRETLRLRVRKRSLCLD